MGKPINTKFDEDYPFMHPDGNALYFASKGHNSLGGYDIFVSRLDAQGNWTAPKNLDFAINTPADDYLFITDMSGETAYFTSNRETPAGEVSVYRINMERVPLDFAFVYGTFNSNETKKAHIKVVDAETEDVIGEYDTDENGKYKIKLPNQGKFNFIVDYENSTVAHSGLVEIQERDAFKPLKQTMEVLNQGAEDEKLVIKNLVDEEVEEDVELTAEYLKSKAKLKVNKDKFKDRKKPKPELVVDEEPEKTTPVDTTDQIASNEPVDVGKAATSIAGEKRIDEVTSSEGPSLVDPGNSDSSGEPGTSVSNNEGGSAGGGGASSGSVGAAGAAGAAGVLAAKKLKVESDNPDKEEIISVTSNNKEALENDEKVYNKQADLSRNIASMSSAEAAQKRTESDKILASLNVSGASVDENSAEYEEAQRLKNEADALDRKAETSNKITEQLAQNAQRSQDLQLVSETYSSKIENQSDVNTNRATYDEYEGKLDENLNKQTGLGEMQKEYLAAYEQKDVAAKNQQAKSQAMQQEITEIEEDIEQKETKLASAKGKEKSELESQIATDKADLVTEKENLALELEQTEKLNQEAALAKADLDAVDELIAQSNEDEEIAQWTNDVSYVESVSPSAGYEPGASGGKLADGSKGSDSTIIDNTGSGDVESTNESDTSSKGDNLASESSTSNTDENSTIGSDNAGSSDENQTDSESDREVNSEGMEVVKSTSNSTDASSSQDANSADGSANSGSSSASNSGTKFVQTEAGVAVGTAVAGSASSWSPEDVNTNEVFDIASVEDLNENELAVLLDSNSEKASAFNPEETNEMLTRSDQSVGSINNSGYNKKYMDQFLELIEDEGSEYEKAVKTYVINESWLMDIEKELSYLTAIEDDVPEEYQDNLLARISNLETLQSSRFSNTESSREKVLDLAQGQGTSDDLKALTDQSRGELNEKLNAVPGDEETEQEGDQLAASSGEEEEPSSITGDGETESNVEGQDLQSSSSENQGEAGGDLAENTGSEPDSDAETANTQGNAEQGNLDEESGASSSDEGEGTGGDELLAVSGQDNTNEGGGEDETGSNQGSSENTGSSDNQGNDTDSDFDESGADESGSTDEDNTSSSSPSNSLDSENDQGSTDLGEESSLNNSSDNNSTTDNTGSSSGDGDGAGATESENNSADNNTPAGNASNSNTENSSTDQGGKSKPKTEIIPGEKSDRLAKVFTAPEKSIDEVVGGKTESASADKEVIDAEVSEMQTTLSENETKLASAKRKERKTLGPQVEQQKRDVADAKNQQEIAEYRIEALARAADQIIALEEGEERESEKEVKRAETLKVEAEEKFAAADAREGEKARGKKKKKAKAVDVANLKGEGERKLAQATASEQLAAEMAELEDEVIYTYKNTPESLPVSNKRLSQAEINNIRQTPEFANYDATRKEAAEYYKKAQVAYVEAEKLENDNKSKESEIKKLEAELEEEGDVDRINELQTKIKELKDAVVVNEENAAAYGEESKRLYSEYNHTNNQAVRMIKSQDPQLQEDLVAYANQLENQGTYAVAPIAGSSLDKDDQEGYSPDAFSRVVKGIDDYPAELTDAIFDMMDFNKSLYNSDNPIPVDTKLPGGVVYKVQIGAFRNPPPDDVFKGFAPVRGENTRPGWVRYTAGLFTSKDQARLKRNEIRALGYGDAFVVAYKDGKRISLSEADQLIAEGYKPDVSSGQQGSSSTATTAAPGEVIPVSSIQGLLYTIQVGAFRNQITSGQLYGITPLIEYQQNGLFKYGSGIYNDRQKAESDKSQVLAAGVSDAFVTAFYNGKRVSLNEAIQIAQQGPGVFANEAPVSVGAGSAVSGSIVFRVQVGAYREEVPLDDAKIILSLSNLGLDVQQNADMTTYTVGRYGSYEDAKQVQERVTGQGLNGAFVVAYENGVRIEVQEAISKLGQ
tara:strand:+ start:16 stop:5775 length:5760 start_codon:yes stop_codon:yes gene_type:complete